jgi:molecular chaperone DnaJ
VSSYYSILSISEKASPEDIGKAYRKLALKYHPDVTHNESSDMFRELTEAYEILKDPEKRKSYDKLLRLAPPKAARVRRGSDIQITLNITADDVAFGKVKNIATTRKTSCPICLGTGSTTRKMTLCTKCNGNGIDIMSSVMGPKKFCQECRGFGNVPENNWCKNCNGSGLITEKIVRQVTVSRDFSPTFTIPGSGNYPSECGIGGVYGNLIISFNLEKSCPFELDGKYIKGKLKISPAQAVLGDKTYIDVFGNAIEVEVPAGSCHGDIIKKEKILVVRDRHKTLHLTIEIDVPKNISEEEKTLYLKLLKIQKGWL